MSNDSIAYNMNSCLDHIIKSYNYYGLELLYNNSYATYSQIMDSLKRVRDCIYYFSTQFLLKFVILLKDDIIFLFEALRYIMDGVDKSDKHVKKLGYILYELNNYQIPPNAYMCILLLDECQINDQLSILDN